MAKGLSHGCGRSFFVVRHGRAGGSAAGGARPVQDCPIVEKCDAYSGKRRNFDI